MIEFYGTPGFKPEIGDLVRYGHGPTSLAILRSPHADGFHAKQCMAGSVYCSRFSPPTEFDRRMWISEHTWRQETIQEAAKEIGYNPDVEGYFPDSGWGINEDFDGRQAFIRGETKPSQVVHNNAFVDSPQPENVEDGENKDDEGKCTCWC